MRAVRSADDRALLGPEESSRLYLYSRPHGLWRAALPEPVRPGARRVDRRPGAGGRRAGRVGGEPGGGGWGRAGEVRAGPPLASASRAGRLRGRTRSPAIPGLRAGESPGRTRAGASLGRIAEVPATARGRLRAMAEDGPRPALARGRASDPLPGRRPAGGVAGVHDHPGREAADR